MSETDDDDALPWLIEDDNCNWGWAHRVRLGPDNTIAEVKMHFGWRPWSYYDAIAQNVMNAPPFSPETIARLRILLRAD